MDYKLSFTEVEIKAAYLVLRCLHNDYKYDESRTEDSTAANSIELVLEKIEQALGVDAMGALSMIDALNTLDELIDD